ncbi:YbaB/EbfC family DNA-binding protein [Micromonospora sp. ALFpr18c]|uniref:YbaB/EbfC family DNA-binding protein n=1 Tax=Micromonospora sp. ALFpr18c TaxID=1458665 RepID=UPI00124B24A6|nr:YbaB/EbfC family DNA-binding protein [Micromonospora sp. ALFpr18c]KAB1946727.1 YbaB/EbfC family DNA-binding protein [Micromonospora sp. ALFpr18c]
MWADDAALDAAGRRLDEWEASLADRAARATALSTRVRALTGTATSPDRSIVVTVDSNGLLTDLRLERIRERSATRIARQIVETTRAAHADLLSQLTTATVETLGDDVSARAIVDSYRSRLHPGPGAHDAQR